MAPGRAEMSRSWMARPRSAATVSRHQDCGEAADQVVSWQCSEKRLRAGGACGEPRHIELPWPTSAWTANTVGSSTSASRPPVPPCVITTTAAETAASVGPCRQPHEFSPGEGSPSQLPQHPVVSVAGWAASAGRAQHDASDNCTSRSDPPACVPQQHHCPGDQVATSRAVSSRMKRESNTGATLGVQRRIECYANGNG